MLEGDHNKAIKTYAGQGYNCEYLARKFRISKQQARQLILKLGHDRNQLNEAGERLKSA